MLAARRCSTERGRPDDAGARNGKYRLVVEKPRPSASWSSRASRMRCMACSLLVGTSDTSRLTSARSCSSLGLSSSAASAGVRASSGDGCGACSATLRDLDRITATSSRVGPRWRPLALSAALSTQGRWESSTSPSALPVLPPRQQSQHRYSRRSRPGVSQQDAFSV